MLWEKMVGRVGVGGFGVGSLDVRMTIPGRGVASVDGGVLNSQMRGDCFTYVHARSF